MWNQQHRVHPTSADHKESPFDFEWNRDQNEIRIWSREQYQTRNRNEQ